MQAQPLEDLIPAVEESVSTSLKNLSILAVNKALGVQFQSSPNSPILPAILMKSKKSRPRRSRADPRLSRLAHMKDTSRVYFLRGFAELAGGALCLLALVAVLYFSRWLGFIRLGLFLLGFMTLTVDGAVSLMRSKRIARFR